MTDLTDTEVTPLRRAAMDAAAAGRVRVLGGHWLPKDQLDSELFFDDNDGLGDAVNLLLQDWAIRLVDPNDPSDFTERLHSGNLTGDEKRTFYLKCLTVQKAVSTYIDGIISDTGDAAMICGAQIADVASAMGITRQGVQKRWGRRARGWMKAAVVIFRPDSSYEFDDSGRSFGEVGVPDQYDGDRGWWLIGKEVRARARYAVVGVNGTVQRVYEIDADSWIRSENGKWQFRAVDDRPLTEEEISAAYATGYLPMVPGNSCQTHPRAAYRPHWFP